MKTFRYDRWENIRRNKQMRAIWAVIAALSLFAAAVVAVDPLVSGQTLLVDWVVTLGVVFAISLGIAVYYHLKFMTRE